MTICQELRIYLSHTMQQMQDLRQQGVISDRLYGHFCWLWLWSAWRDDFRHNRFYDRMGSDAYWRRIERVKAIVDRINAIPLPPPEHIPFRVGSLNP